MVKSIIKYILFALLAVVIALILVPYLYKGELLAKLKTGLNEQLNAKVDFEDLDLSLIRSFPELQLKLVKPSIHNLEPFKDELLFKSATLTVTTPFKALFSDELVLKINTLSIDEAEINILVNKAGKANYDIIPTSENQGESIEINFENYSLNNSQLNYLDYSSNTFLTAKEVNHKGSGNIYEQVYDLNTINQIGYLDLSMDGIKYLNRARLNGKALISIDNNQQKYSFKETDIKLNDLPLSIDGFAAIQNTTTLIDLSISSKESSFASLLSLIPNNYTGEIAQIDSKGKAQFKGTIKGKLDAKKGLNPRYDFDISIKDGYAKYPGFSESISGANAQLSFVSQGNKSKVNIPKFDLNIGGDPVSGSLAYDDFDKEARINSELNSDLDLKKLKNAFPLDEIIALEGRLKSDIKIDALLKDIELANYKDIEFSGEADLKDFKYQSKHYPVIEAKELHIDAQPEKLNIRKSQLVLGQSDLNIEGEVNNPLAYFTETKNLSGDIKLKSKYINTNEWISEEGDHSAKAASNQSEIDALAKSSGIILNAEIAQLDYDVYELKENKIDASFNDDVLKINNYKGAIYDNDFTMNGQLEGLYDYVVYNKLLNGNLNINADKFNSNPFFTTEVATEEATAYRVPEMIDLDINAEVKELLYGDLALENVDAALEVKDQKIDFTEVETKGLGGKMSFSGYYQSLTKDPEFKLNYDLSNIRFDQAYQSLNVIQKLAPIMNLIDGKFNSTLSMEGKLDNKMEVLLNSLDASGFVQTVHGVINKLKPLNTLGEKLGINSFEPLDISESKNWFEIEKGLVALKPQTHKKGAMTFEISGTHSFEQEMNYTMMTSIPRTELSKSTTGQVVDKGLGWLETEASKIGVDLDQGENIKLDIRITGSIKNPKFKITPLGSEGKTIKDQVKDEVKDQIAETKDKIKDKANEELDKTKDTITQVIDQTVDSISTEVEEKVDTLVNEVKDKVMDEINTKIDTVVGEFIGNKLDTLINDKINDVLGDKAKEEADKVKDKLKNWNPFGDKKKGN